MHFLNQSAFLKALGWALVNSFWQFGVLWLIFVLVLSVKKNLSATVKHGLAVTLISTGFVWSLAGLCIRYFEYSANVATVFDTAFGSGFYFFLNHFLEKNLAYLSLVYLLVVFALFFKFLRYFYFSHKIQTQGLIKVRAQLRMYVEKMAQQMNIKRRVSIWLSQYVDTPVIIGFLRPTILIPVACINQLSVSQMEAVILHELAHIKRNDYLLNLFIAMTEIVYFFNPFSRLLIKALKQERENSCDDWVLQFRFDPIQYASALLSLEKNRVTYLPLSIASTGSGSKTLLLHRVQRILQVRTTETGNNLKFFAYFLSVGLLTLVAFLNPGTVVIKNLSAEFLPVKRIFYASLETSSQKITPTETVFIQQPHTENNLVKTHQNPVKAFVVTRDTCSSDPANMSSELAGRNNILAINVAELALDGLDETNRLVTALAIEKRDFAQPEIEQPLAPASMSTDVFPFVPRSSFSFVLADTSKPLTKKESYYERNARESLVKAQKAIDKIDWKKIEKQFQNKVDVSQLKKEIENSLNEVNWQQINQEVKESFEKENIEKMKTLQKEAEDVQRYKAQSIELQRIQENLNEQQDIYQRELEKQKIQIRKGLQDERQKTKVRKTIVYI
jgi:beta-lactamase regulating signal transducer with metallopeptidase domain